MEKNSKNIQQYDYNINNILQEHDISIVLGDSNTLLYDNSLKQL